MPLDFLNRLAFERGKIFARKYTQWVEREFCGQNIIEYRPNGVVVKDNGVLTLWLHCNNDAPVKSWRKVLVILD